MKPRPGKEINTWYAPCRECGSENNAICFNNNTWTFVCWYCKAGNLIVDGEHVPVDDIIADMEEEEDDDDENFLSDIDP